MRARLHCLYASTARRCPVLGAGGMKAGEESYRLFSCGRCARQVRICRGCDHGNRYCAGGCAAVRRRESLHRAGARYQCSYRGASRHAARQSAWRGRQVQKVTHHGSLDPAPAGTVTTSSPPCPPPEGTHADRVSLAALPSTLALVAGQRTTRGPLQRRSGSAGCSFCDRPLPRFARLGTLHGGP
jgi:hypothetical protein